MIEIKQCYSSKNRRRGKKERKRERERERKKEGEQPSQHTADTEHGKIALSIESSSGGGDGGGGRNVGWSDGPSSLPSVHMSVVAGLFIY